MKTYSEDCVGCGRSICGRFGERVTRCPGCQRAEIDRRKRANRQPTAEERRELLARWTDAELSYREEQVLRMREAGMTLAAIGARFNVTRERARQLEAGAFRKLRG